MHVPEGAANRKLKLTRAGCTTFARDDDAKLTLASLAGPALKNEQLLASNRIRMRARSSAVRDCLHTPCKPELQHEHVAEDNGVALLEEGENE